MHFSFLVSNQTKFSHAHEKALAWFETMQQTDYGLFPLDVEKMV